MWQKKYKLLGDNCPNDTSTIQFVAGSRTHGRDKPTSTWALRAHTHQVTVSQLSVIQPPLVRINNGLFCVLGREGGLKVQRKFGDIFLLHLQLKVVLHICRNDG